MIVSMVAEPPKNCYELLQDPRAASSADIKASCYCYPDKSDSSKKNSTQADVKDQIQFWTLLSQ